VLREILARFELAPTSETIARDAPRGVTLAPRGGARVRVLDRRAPARNEAAAATAV
jgi:hypothetical protein